MSPAGLRIFQIWHRNHWTWGSVMVESFNHSKDYIMTLESEWVQWVCLCAVDTFLSIDIILVWLQPDAFIILGMPAI